MSTDRELLEMAAKAFWADEIDDVVSIEWGDLDASILYTHADNQDHNGHDRTYRWNPLEENHDAFELAVKLRLDLFNYDERTGHEVEPYVEAVPMLGTDGERGGEYLGTNPYAATRRAIVRAAAEIGKARHG